jgi:ribonuclease HII
MLKSCYGQGTEAGCDEAGRGCLAGPVVAAAVILPPDFKSELLNDSKQLSEKQRLQAREEVYRAAISYGIGTASPAEIDEINILNASFLAMHRAIDKLEPKAERLLIDGNRFQTYGETPHVCIVKGDALYYPIAAASILAKTYRDEYMKNLATEFPAYGWDTNVGYPTRTHREGIRQQGPSPHHRLSFQLLPAQLRLFEA